MVINYQGGNYFKITSGETTILIDPENQRSFRGAAVILKTEKTKNDEVESGEGFLVNHQGEYGVKGVQIKGFSSDESDEKSEKTNFRLIVDEITIGIITSIKKFLNPDTQENLKGMDILILGIGENKENAAKLVRQLEPGIVIPSNFKDLKPFLKELNQVNVKPEEKLTIKKKEIPIGSMTVKWLTA